MEVIVLALVLELTLGIVEAADALSKDVEVTGKLLKSSGFERYERNAAVLGVRGSISTRGSQTES